MNFKKGLWKQDRNWELDQCDLTQPQKGGYEDKTEAGELDLMWFDWASKRVYED